MFCLRAPQSDKTALLYIIQSQKVRVDNGAADTQNKKMNALDKTHLEYFMIFECQG